MAMGYPLPSFYKIDDDSNRAPPRGVIYYCIRKKDPKVKQSSEVGASFSFSTNRVRAPLTLYRLSLSATSSHLLASVQHTFPVPLAYCCFDRNEAMTTLQGQQRETSFFILLLC